MMDQRLTKTLALAGALSAAVVPAAYGHPGRADHPAHGKSHRCVAHRVGYTAHGAVTAVALTQTAGADTPTDRGDDRYSGTLTFDVTHRNHHARGDATAGTYTLDNVRVKLADGLTAATVAAGDAVKVVGKITAVSRKCSDASGAGQVTLRQVVFHQASDTSGSPDPTG